MKLRPNVDGTIDILNTAGEVIQHFDAAGKVSFPKDNWDGVAYTDPLAIGANATAKIYPDGSIVGETDNGKYTRWPNGEMECRGLVVCTSMGAFGSGSMADTYRTNVAIFTYPVLFVGDLPVVTMLVNRIAGASTGANSPYSARSLSSGALNELTSIQVAGGVNTGFDVTVGVVSKGRWKA